jgi:membrane associated rhomboid family serine protease
VDCRRLLAHQPPSAYLRRGLIWNASVTVSREPIFNVPTVVLVLIALLCVVHAVFMLVLSPAQATEFLITLSFIPARYDLSVLADESWVHGWGAAGWSFVTYAFLHGSFSHLFFNVIWLLAFCTPVARRFGALRFTLFFMVTAAAGAFAHLITHLGEMLPMVGASAAISGAMAAALRFVFQSGGPLGLLRKADAHAYHVPAAPLGAMLRSPRALAFIAVWFGVNALFGATGLAMPGTEAQSVAWQAHVGGFLAGLFGFAAFDREAPPAPDAEIEASEGADLPHG